MGPLAISYSFIFCALFLLGYINRCFTNNCELEARHTALLTVNTSSQKIIPDTLFGIFFEEINHAGAGGVWAELVSNRGFEAGGPNTPSNIAPWSIIGDESFLSVYTEFSSCFLRNKVALRMDILCNNVGSVVCPIDGVGVYNPGFWGMNIEQGQTYRLILYVKSLDSVNITVSLTSGDGLEKLSSVSILAEASYVSNWRRVEYLLEATGTNRNASLRLTTTRKGVIWLDQISLMPLDTYKGHGFRKDLIAMVEDLKPRFIRFPGGCFVEGEWLRNAFRWRETIGPWEERPGHFGDVWMYWTDDGLDIWSFFRLHRNTNWDKFIFTSCLEFTITHFDAFLQLSEDLSASPVWVFNNGISHQDQVDTSSILPFVQDILDSIEFARGSLNSTWGSVRAKLGHPEPFQLEYVAIGNEDCWKKNYRGNYMKFYYAIKDAYPDIKIISNCDGSSRPLDHPADLYDFHVYTNARRLFSMNKQFDHTSRSGPKAFVSEYAVTGRDAGTGSLLASLGEAAFLIGIERNSDVVEMASYAPLFVNANDRRWNPDAIVFNSWQLYGTPSYWMQQFFKESSGAIFLNSLIQSKFSDSLVASAIIWQDSTSKYLKIKIVNFGSNTIDLRISVDGLPNIIGHAFKSNVTELTSSNIMDENSFMDKTKVKPLTSSVPYSGSDTIIPLSPYSFTSIDLPFPEMKYIATI